MKFEVSNNQAKYEHPPLRNESIVCVGILFENFKYI